MIDPTVMLPCVRFKRRSLNHIGAPAFSTAKSNDISEDIHCSDPDGDRMLLRAPFKLFLSRVGSSDRLTHITARRGPLSRDVARADMMLEMTAATGQDKPMTSGESLEGKAEGMRGETLLRKSAALIGRGHWKSSQSTSSRMPESSNRAPA